MHSTLRKATTENTFAKKHLRAHTDTSKKVDIKITDVA
jgi:hypothetical protein